LARFAWLFTLPHLSVFTVDIGHIAVRAEHLKQRVYRFFHDPIVIGNCYAYLACIPLIIRLESNSACFGEQLPNMEATLLRNPIDQPVDRNSGTIFLFMLIRPTETIAKH